MLWSRKFSCLAEILEIARQIWGLGDWEGYSQQILQQYFFPLAQIILGQTKEGKSWDTLWSWKAVDRRLNSEGIGA
jgi:hypothetical protein